MRCDLAGLLGDQGARLGRGEAAAEVLADGGQVDRQGVGLALVDAEDAVLVVRELGELVDVVPHPLVRGVEQVGAVDVDLDAGRAARGRRALAAGRHGRAGHPHPRRASSTRRPATCRGCPPASGTRCSAGSGRPTRGRRATGASGRPRASAPPAGCPAPASWSTSRPSAPSAASTRATSCTSRTSTSPSGSAGAAGCTSTRRRPSSSTRAGTPPGAIRTGCSGCTTPARCATG